MNKRISAWAAAVILAVTLAGCSSENGLNSAGVGASNSPAGSQNSAAVSTPDVNDAEEGGGAGGTNDVDNDGRPETKGEIREHNRRYGGLDDTGRIVDDAAHRIGDAVRDAGDAVRGGVNSALH